MRNASAMRNAKTTKRSRADRDDEFERPEGQLRAQLVRVRARFGVDLATSIGTLPEPWTSPSGAVEEDEAEFADALADCLSVGLPLDAAVASWASGELAQGGEDEEGEAGAWIAVRTAPARRSTPG